MAAAYRRNLTRILAAGTALALGLATSALAQTQPRRPAPAPTAPAPPRVNTTESLKLPQNPEIFGSAMPSVIKATAIVNGEVITQTDVDQRLALLAIANGSDIPADEAERLRQQILRNLIDETLEIQAAKAEKIVIKSSDIDKALVRVAQNVKQTPAQLSAYLDAHGSNVSSLRRQIEGELAWRRLQNAKIEVTVGDDEVKAVIDRLNAAKGTQEYHVGEIFLSSTPATASQTLDNANKIEDALRQGASFAGYARQYSEASTAAVGGDLGWVRPEQLPPQLGTVITQMPPGSLSPPIQVNGGYSILAVQDVRKVLTADPRDAVLSLKQVSIGFPAGTTRQQAEPKLARFAEAARTISGCGGAEKIATDFNGEVVQRDDVKIRDLPAALQQLILPLQVGQATQPFGGIQEGVRTLVVCGRDEVADNEADFDAVYSQLNEERVNSRSRRYLSDLRRDAVIEFR